MGSVYLARDDLSGQEVAVKVLPAALSREADIRERFLQEARALASLDHEAIVPLVTFARSGDDHFLVMKYVAGRSLEQLIERDKQLDIELCRKVFRTVVEALGYAHERGVIHRDVKPANVLLSEEGRIFVVDFGIAKREVEARLTQTGMLMGTPQYMSPEQISGHPLDGRSDLYAAGLLLFEMLTGRPPFTGEKTFLILRQHVEAPVPDPRSLRDGEIPPDLLFAMSSLLKKDPAERPRDAAELLRLLDGELPEGQLTFDGAPARGLQLSEPFERTTPLTTTVDDRELDRLEVELRSRGGLRAALLALLVGAIVLAGAVYLLPDLVRSASVAEDDEASDPSLDPRVQALHVLLEEANRQIHAGKPRKALAILEATLEQHPEDKTALFLRARALVELKRPSSAKKALDELEQRADLDDDDRALLENYRDALSGVAPRQRRRRPPARKRSTEAAPAAAAAPTLDEATLRQVAGSRRREARECYERHSLDADPGAAGLVTLEVLIEPTGEVTNVKTVEQTVSAGGPALASCLEGLASEWRFPAQEGRAPLSFRYTLDFSPTLVMPQ